MHLINNGSGNQAKEFLPSSPFSWVLNLRIKPRFSATLVPSFPFSAVSCCHGRSDAAPGGGAARLSTTWASHTRPLSSSSRSGDPCIRAREHHLPFSKLCKHFKQQHISCFMRLSLVPSYILVQVSHNIWNDLLFFYYEYVPPTCFSTSMKQ